MIVTISAKKTHVYSQTQAPVQLDKHVMVTANLDTDKLDCGKEYYDYLIQQGQFLRDVYWIRYLACRDDIDEKTAATRMMQGLDRMGVVDKTRICSIFKVPVEDVVPASKLPTVKQ